MSRRLASFVAILFVSCAATSCVRYARPEELPREVYAGEPVRLGQDGPAWDYGDGKNGTLGTHSFARAGVFAVSVNGGREAFEVHVLPRPVLRAIPAEATDAIWIPAPKDDARGIVDFCEHAAGGFFSSSGADRDPFLRYLLELAGQPPSEELAVDREEGLAVFTLPGIDARIAAVGIDDDAKAVAGARGLWAGSGFAASPADEAGKDRAFMLLEHPDGDRIALFTSRGYLYLVSIGSTEGGDVVANAIADQVRAAAAGGLGDDAEVMKANARISSAGGAPQALALGRSVRAGAFELSRVVAQLSVHDEVLDVSAALDADAPLWDAVNATEPRAPLFDAAEGAQFFAVASADPKGLGKIVETFLRQRPQRGGHAADLDRGGASKPATGNVAETVERVMSGDASFVANINVERTLARLSAREAIPDFEGEWSFLATVRDCDSGNAMLNALFEELFALPTASKKERPGALLYDVELGDERSAVAGCDPGMQTMWFATKRDGAAADPKALRARFGEDAFSRGHLSVLLDVGALFRELQMPPKDEAARTMQDFAATFLEQLTGIDTVFVDVVPDAAGGKARAQVRLRTSR